MESTLQAVFFDAGGTILNVRSSVGEIYAEAAARLGHPVEPQALNLAFRCAWKRSLDRRREARYAASDEILREEWRKIVSDCFYGLVPPEVAGQAFEDLYDRFSSAEPWLVAEGAREALSALREDGLELGILSNWDGRLPGCLEKLGILEFFNHLVVSYEVGVEKPHPKIFEEAVRRAGAPPGALLLVGDSLEQDILPALDLGWHALWLSREDPVKRIPGIERVKDFGEILARVRERRSAKS